MRLDLLLLGAVSFCMAMNGSKLLSKRMGLARISVAKHANDSRRF